MKKLPGLICLLLLGLISTAQVQRSSGMVLDDKGQPVPFATVTEKGTRNAVQAAADGKFAIDVNSNAILVVTAVGFRETEASAGSNITVTLVRGASGDLQEVVVTALGIQRQKKELGYATAKVANRELNQASPVNAANGLQGKVSGLNITSVNNGVFGEVKINLRGLRSLTGNNNPMLLLDGVPTPLAYFSSINPNDIEDITVLKGAAGAGLYGTDARNGVIVVTTKKGVRDGKPVITVSHTTQLEQISFFPKFQTRFGSGAYGEYLPSENWQWGDEYDGSVRPIGRPLEDGSQETTVYSPTNERKKFFNTGVVNQTNISMATRDFYMSIQDASISGIVPGDKNRRTGVRLNTSKEYGVFRVAVNMNYVQQNYDIFDDDAMSDWQRNMNGVGYNDGLMNLIFNTPAHIRITSYKDFKRNPFASFNGYFNDYGLNPYFALDNWRQKGKKDDVLANVDFIVKPTKWLDITYRAGVSLNTLAAQSTSKGEIPSDYARSVRAFIGIPGAFSELSSRESRLSSELVLNARKELGDFRLNFITGHYFRQNEFETREVGVANLVVPEIYNINNRTGELNGENERQLSRLMGVYGVAGISYKGWANLEITGRNDWTSVLAPGNNSYFYPGASASFVLSDAVELIRNSRVVSYAKLRASIQKTGNSDIDPYSLNATFDQATGFPYGNIPGYTAVNTAFDPNLKPEFSVSHEVGVELGFFRNRVNLELAYYTQKNSNLIIPIRVSEATGYRNSNVNAAEFVNQGLEIDLKLTPLVSFRKGNIQLRMNAAYNTSEVKKIYEGLESVFIGGFSSSGGNYAIVGQPAFVFRSTDYMRDEHGRVIVNRSTGYPIADPNPKQFGRSLPKWILGINPSVNWNGFQLSATVEHKGGHKVYHGFGPDMVWTGVAAATAVNGREPFVIPNSVYDDGTGKYVPNTNVAVANVNDFFISSYRTRGTNFLTSAASWRIRELSLSYSMPSSWLRGQGIVKGATITLNARNLALFVPKTNIYSDPDFNFNTGNTSGVSDSQINPPTRHYGANITITF